MSKAYELNLSLGFKPFIIHFDGISEPVKILFNPADADLPKRLFEAQKRIDAETKSVKDFKVDENGIPDTDEYIEKMEELKKIVFDAVDFAFGNTISESVFKYCSPFSIVDGKLFVLHFFEQITPHIQKIVESERVTMNKNTEALLKKYGK